VRALVPATGARRLAARSGGQPDLLRFNHSNEWRLAGADHHYGFAFEDWRFDRQLCT
jgi:hypothetical protein